MGSSVDKKAEQARLIKSIEFWIFNFDLPKENSKLESKQRTITKMNLSDENKSYNIWWNAREIWGLAPGVQGIVDDDDD